MTQQEIIEELEEIYEILDEEICEKRIKFVNSPVKKIEPKNC